MNVQQVYYLRSLIPKEHVLETETSFYLFVFSLCFFIVYLRLTQQKRLQPPSKITKDAPDWKEGQNILFHCRDVQLFLRYLCTKKYTNHPILIVADFAIQLDTSYFYSHHKRLSAKEISKIESWLQKQSQQQKMPLLLFLQDIHAPFLEHYMFVGLKYVSYQSEDVWVWSQSVNEDSTLERII